MECVQGWTRELRAAAGDFSSKLAAEFANGPFAMRAIIWERLPGWPHRLRAAAGDFSSKLAAEIANGPLAMRTIVWNVFQDGPTGGGLPRATAARDAQRTLRLAAWRAGRHV